MNARTNKFLASCYIFGATLDIRTLSLLNSHLAQQLRMHLGNCFPYWNMDRSPDFSLHKSFLQMSMLVGSRWQLQFLGSCTHIGSLDWVSDCQLQPVLVPGIADILGSEPASRRYFFSISPFLSRSHMHRWLLNKWNTFKKNSFSKDGASSMRKSFRLLNKIPHVSGGNSASGS